MYEDAILAVRDFCFYLFNSQMSFAKFPEESLTLWRDVRCVLAFGELSGI